MQNHAEIDLDTANASLYLEGKELPNGWIVGEAHGSDDRSSGSFSISYSVTHSSGRRGFMKVLDLVTVFGELEDLQAAINDYLAERDLLVLCGEARMSRVVSALDHGRITLDGFLPGLSTVYYIIFEHASDDMNSALSEADVLDVSFRLRLLHHLAVGVHQLHRRKVAHQDLKPANTLVFTTPGSADREGKIADLGRAFRSDRTTPHDTAVMPGDRSFAPPEQLYGFAHPDVEIRRFGADLYQLGSMICFTFGGVTMNALLAERLSPEHHWRRFADGYRQALPYLQEAYSAVLADLRSTFPSPVADEMTAMVEYLCQPDCERRGHPRALRYGGVPYSLERVVSELNLAAFRADVAGKAA